MQEQHSWMDVERRSGTYQFGVEEGRAQGREEGLQEGLTVGRQEGLTVGRQEGLTVGRQEGLQEGLMVGRQALVGLIFDLLAERGVDVDAQAEGQIRSCEDLQTLQRWARAAIHASSTAELLAWRG